MMLATAGSTSGPEAKGPHWHVAMQPGKRRKLDLTHEWARMLNEVERIKASARAKVEHPFHVIKNLFRTRRFATRAWPRTRRSCSARSDWPTSSWSKGDCWTSMPEVRLEREQRLRKRPRTAFCRSVAAFQRAAPRRYPIADHRLGRNQPLISESLGALEA